MNAAVAQVGKAIASVSTEVRSLLSFPGPPAQTTQHPSFGSRLDTLENSLKLALHGAPKALEGDVKKLMNGDGNLDAARTVSRLSNAQLGAMNDNQLGALGRGLTAWDVGRLVGQHVSSAQLFRVLTAHGMDMGHVDAISSRLGYLKSPLSYMSGAPRVAFDQLLKAGAAKPGDWAGFQSYVDAATGTVQRPGTSVTPMIDGKVAFPRFYQAIDHAKSSVNMSVFEFHSDSTGWEMARHLAGAADRGCHVRLVYDPVGSVKTGNAPTDPGLFQYMRQHGVQVIAQTPGPLDDWLTHRKVMVIDGNTGFIGGMNVADEWSKSWHDVHSEVHGPGVADIQHLFLEQWARDGGKIAKDQQAALFPHLDPVGSASARVIGHEGLVDQNMKLAYLRAIDTSQKTINVANPYFSDPDVVAHLEAAAKRGVAVNIVLPKHNNQAAEQLAEKALYGQLLRAGIHIWEYHGAPMAHEKVATFDGTISTIGSSNLDARSLAHNDEANIWTSDPAVAQDLNQQLFAHDYPQSDSIHAHNPGWLAEAGEDVAGFFSSHL